MILDSSAVVAIVLREPGHEALLAKLSAATAVGIGAPTLAETAVVLAAKLHCDPAAILSRLIKVGDVAIVPFGEEHAEEAWRAYLRFGKGRHPARLNFGDCMAYATAKLAGDTLLCTGGDFPKTDLSMA